VRAARSAEKKGKPLIRQPDRKGVTGEADLARPLKRLNGMMEREKRANSFLKEVGGGGTMELPFLEPKRPTGILLNATRKEKNG